MIERNARTMTSSNHSDIFVTASPMQGLPLFVRLTSLDALLNLRLLP